MDSQLSSKRGKRKSQRQVFWLAAQNERLPDIPSERWSVAPCSFWQKAAHSSGTVRDSHPVPSLSHKGEPIALANLHKKIEKQVKTPIYFLQSPPLPTLTNVGKRAICRPVSRSISPLLALNVTFLGKKVGFPFCIIIFLLPLSVGSHKPWETRPTRKNQELKQQILLTNFITS